jgi:hypothetical protein
MWEDFFGDGSEPNLSNGMNPVKVHEAQVLPINETLLEQLYFGSIGNVEG